MFIQSYTNVHALLRNCRLCSLAGRVTRSKLRIEQTQHCHSETLEKKLINPSLSCELVLLIHAVVTMENSACCTFRHYTSKL